MNGLVAWLNYLEWDKGFDPIGASDILSDAADWYRAQDPGWLAWASVEEKFEAFIRSDVLDRYWPGGVSERPPGLRGDGGAV